MKNTLVVQRQGEIQRVSDQVVISKDCVLSNVADHGFLPFGIGRLAAFLQFISTNVVIAGKVKLGSKLLCSCVLDAT